MAIQINRAIPFFKINLIKWLKRTLLFGLLFLFTQCSDDQKTKNVFLITWDGYRWQELFSGADSLLIGNKKYVGNLEELKNEFWHDDTKMRRKKLTPFIWSEIEKMGQIYGNRTIGSAVSISNPHRFSYPGYSEILVGYVDERIDSNKKMNNPNKTVLEIINEQPQFNGRVAAFGSWDVFPYIINEERSGIPVNAGFENAVGEGLTEMERSLNTIQSQLPKIWNTVRYDAFTHHYAKEYIKKNKPNVVYIAYGETDDFAHDGDYEAYLKSAKQTDAFVKDLWEFVQSDEQYKDNTVFIITTDHGRGTDPIDNWRNHGSKYEGTDQTWMIAWGAGIKAKGEVSNSVPIVANQIASTIATILGINYESINEVGKPIDQILKVER